MALDGNILSIFTVNSSYRYISHRGTAIFPVHVNRVEGNPTFAPSSTPNKVLIFCSWSKLKCEFIRSVSRLWGRIVSWHTVQSSYFRLTSTVRRHRRKWYLQSGSLPACIFLSLQSPSCRITPSWMNNTLTCQIHWTFLCCQLNTLELFTGPIQAAFWRVLGFVALCVCKVKGWQAAGFIQISGVECLARNCQQNWSKLLRCSSYKVGTVNWKRLKKFKGVQSNYVLFCVIQDLKYSFETLLVPDNVFLRSWKFWTQLSTKSSMEEGRSGAGIVDLSSIHVNCLN